MPSQHFIQTPHFQTINVIAAATHYMSENGEAFTFELFNTTKIEFVGLSTSAGSDRIKETNMFFLYKPVCSCNVKKPDLTSTICVLL